MFSTIKSRRQAEAYRQAHVAVIGPGYTFDITKKAAKAGVTFGVLRLDAPSGFYYVNEPFGYYDVQDLPKDPRK
jgi:hypothetical protein